MRQDQFEKLQHLTEKLTDVLIGEIDPQQWPGHGIAPNVMDRDTRGDRYWCKKNAAATLSALTRLHTIIGLVQRTAPPPAPEDDDIETEIASAEREALRAIEAAQSRAKKAGGGGKRAK